MRSPEAVQVVARKPVTPWRGIVARHVAQAFRRGVHRFVSHGAVDVQVDQPGQQAAPAGVDTAGDAAGFEIGCKPGPQGVNLPVIGEQPAGLPGTGRAKYMSVVDEDLVGHGGLWVSQEQSGIRLAVGRLVSWWLAVDRGREMAGQKPGSILPCICRFKLIREGDSEKWGAGGRGPAHHPIFEMTTL